MRFRDLVVIVASIAGMRTLCRLTDQLPSSFRAPILTVLHASPEGIEPIDKMLGIFTEMPVLYGTEGVVLEAGSVYLTPPDWQLIVASPGALSLVTAAEADQSRFLPQTVCSSLRPWSTGPGSSGSYWPGAARRGCAPSMRQGESACCRQRKNCASQACAP